MKISFLFMLFEFASFTHVFCQPIFNNDTSFKASSETLYSIIDSSFNLEKNNDFEMRFWCTYSKTMKRQLFILALKNNNWTARLFEKPYFQKDTLLEIKINQNDLNYICKQKLLITNSFYSISADGSAIINQSFPGYG